ncbi:UDP-glucuronosyltransferase 1A1-like isoform X2 [Stigmatopora argus]
MTTMRTVMVCTLWLLNMALAVALDKTSRSEAKDNIAVSNTTSYVGKLLVIPMDGSHWVGMKAIAQEMGRRGHSVTVVMPEITILISPGEHYETLRYPLPFDKAFVDFVMSKNEDVLEKSALSFFERIQEKISQIQRIAGLLHTTAESLLFNASVITHLAQQGFDAVLTDPMVPTGAIIARKLGEYFSIAICSLHPFNTACSYLGCRIDFTLEYPRPLMPNMVPVGGINCNVRNPLPKDLEPWVSGKHGFVIFTLGTALKKIPIEMTQIFFDAFKQIPQKVIWRYSGIVPDNTPENIKMMSWVPQNDLLAHPGARAFITHAGSHGLFEAICHAIPMVMLPLGGDQPDNAARLEDRGGGVVLDILSVTAEDLLQRLSEVINDIRYKENMKRLSALHKDRPVDPLDLSVYWTEFVMRHKGAGHLKAAAHELYWFQYFCLDVIALLATTALILTLLILKCLRFFWKKLSRKRKQH